MRLTVEEAQALQAQQEQKIHGIGKDPADDIPDPGPESNLSRKITAWAKARGIPCWCRPQSQRLKGVMPPGWPD